MKRSNGYYYAHTHTHHPATVNRSSDAQSNKRRRQKEELQYTAATIQSAFTNAGRPPMSIMTRNRRERALPMGSVDMECARVITSDEFDEMDDNNDQLDGAEEQSQAEAETKTQESSKSYGTDEYDVSSMYMLSGLIQSTRNYYGFSCDDTATITAGNSNNHHRQSSNNDETNLTQVYSNYNDEKLGQDNSEGLSSWTPSISSCNDLNEYNDKKNIDNDNRSDGQSSDMGNSADEGDETLSSYSISSTMYSSSYLPRRRRKGNGEGEIRRESYNAANNADAPFSIIG